MTVHNFTKIFKPSEEKVTWKKMAGKRMAVDANLEIARHTGTQYRSQLTNAAGERTAHIRGFLSNLIQCKTNNIKQVWVFDNRIKNVDKDDELERRAELRKKAEDEVAELEKEVSVLTERFKTTKIEILRKVNPEFEKTLEDKKALLHLKQQKTYTRTDYEKARDDLMRMLDAFGVTHCESPERVEAEHLCAAMTRNGTCDLVMTTDADTLAFGATGMAKKEGDKYSIYMLQDCLEQHQLTMRQFIEVCVCMGGDMAAKVKGIGEKTVVGKVKSMAVKWEPHHLYAVSLYEKAVDADKVKMHENTCTKQKLQSLRDWLVNEQGFGADRLDKQLLPVLNSLG